MSTQREIYTGTNVSSGLAAAVYATDQNGSGIDTVGYQSLMFIVNCGAEGVTLDASTNYILFEVEESDTSASSGFTDVADADLTNVDAGLNTGTFKKLDDDADAPGMFFVGYKGNKRWVRVVVNFVGTHGTGTAVGVTAIQQHPATSPVNATS